jgi:hypothetical protein
MITRRDTIGLRAGGSLQTEEKNAGMVLLEKDVRD